MTSDNRTRKRPRSCGDLTRRTFLQYLSVGSLGIATPTRGRVLFRGRSVNYDFERVREGILAALKSHAATGVAVAVAHRGRIIWEEGFGWASRGMNVKASEHTPFCLASITKPFTTTAMMTLVAEQRISLDDSANKYLGRASSLKGDAEGATLRLLGAHAAGLPSMFEMYPNTGDARQPSSTRLLENYGTLAYPPNEVYEYSNIGFEALAEIASNITGLEFADFLKRRVLDPLGLHDSFFDADKGRLANGAALYDELDRPIAQYFTATPSSGELYVSAHDLALFALFNLKTHLGGQAPILSDQLISELHKPVFFGPSRRAATTFGWFTGETKSGLPVISKSGGQPGASTIMYMVPRESLACVALANRSDNGEFVQKLADEMAARIIPNWTTPNVSVDLPSVDFPGGPIYTGKWAGNLHGGGAEMVALLEINASAKATLALGNKSPETITGLALQGKALVGKSVGRVESPDAIRNRATSLSLKVKRFHDKLAGRILATATGPGELAILPYVVQLGRSK